MDGNFIPECPYYYINEGSSCCQLRPEEVACTPDGCYVRIQYQDKIDGRGGEN